MIMRYLKPNKGTTLPGEVCFLGVAAERKQDSGDKRHELLYLSSFAAKFTRLENAECKRNSELYNCNAETFWHYLDNRTSKNRPVTVYAYDVTQAVTLLGLWRQLDQGIYHRGTIIDSDPPVIINIHSVAGRVCFVDVRNYFAMSIDDLGRSFGVKHIEIEPQIVSEGYQYVEASWRQKVAEVSMLTLMRFVRQHDLGRFKTTIGMQAMQSFRHRFAPRTSRCVFGGDGSGDLAPKTIVKAYPIMHDRLDIKEFERAANYSGHDECLFVGEVKPQSQFFTNGLKRGFATGNPYIYGPVYHVDCNSLYPYVMKWGRYPKRFIGERNEATIDHLGILLGKYCVIARVLVDSNTDTFPVRNANGVLYCTGKYWTTLCGKELEYAWRSGAIVRVGYHVCYETIDLFSEYVSYFYNRKLEYQEQGDKAMELVSKMLLNTLQGKFCQRAKKWRERSDVAPQYRWGRWYVIDYDTGKIYRYRSIAGQTQEECVDDEVSYSMPAIGAVVTANARNMMAGIREMCGKANVLYQGTDSLLLLEPGYKIMCDAGLIHKTELGAFKLKGVYENATIRNTQDYELGGQRTTRGLPKGARIVQGNAYSFETRQSLQGMLFTIPTMQILYTNVERTFNGSYTGGSVGKDGWVTPYHLNYQEDRGDAWEGDNLATDKATNVAERTKLS